jgi:hypothetical protein
MESLLPYIQHPETLGPEALETLRTAVAAHPYCAAYRVLYAIAMGNVHSLQLPETIRQTAVYVPDRFHLLALTNQGEAEWVGLMADHNRRQAEHEMAVESAAAEQEDGGFNLIDRYLDHQALPAANGELPLYDVTANLAALDDAPLDTEEDSQDALINSFIEAEQQGTLFVPETAQDETRPTETTIEKIRDSAFLTESLAKIYIKQHKYAQALAIIRDLSLKYPEKNVYFADQIRFLEKIIDFRTNKNN